MNMGHWILKDRKIKKVSLLVWANWLKKSDKLIGSDKIKGIHISTIFLGIDHGFNFGEKKEKPVLFETMIFGSKHKALEYYQVRYKTLKEAEEGHKYAVKFTKNILSAKNTAKKYVKKLLQ